MKPINVNIFEKSILNTFKVCGCAPGSYLPRQQYDSWYLDKYQIQFGQDYYSCFIQALLNLAKVGLIELGPSDEFLKGHKYNVRLTNKGYSRLG